MTTNKSTKKHVWTAEDVKKFKAAIKAERETYATIAERLKVTPQTVWAQINKDKVKVWRDAAKKAEAKRSKSKAKGKAKTTKAKAKAKAKVVKLVPKAHKAA